MANEDRSGLFNDIQKFSQRKLKKVETKVVTGLGEQLIEKRGAKGLQTIKVAEVAQSGGGGSEIKLDLSVGLVIPGILISASDAAQDKDTLESVAVTHILNLAGCEVDNAFEDDYNYKSIKTLLDSPQADLKKHYDECFDFIDEGKHYGNCLVHCSGGVSRSTAIITAYLMTKEKMPLEEALVKVKEARAFAKMNEGFTRQLTEYNAILFSANKKNETIDDPFTLKLRAEREQEKEMLKSMGNLKTRMAAFGTGGLEAPPVDRARSASPSTTRSNGSAVPIPRTGTPL